MMARSHASGPRHGIWVAVMALVLLAPWVGRAQIQVDITQGVIKPLPIAITDFVGAEGADSEIGRQISGVIRNNLSGSGLFGSIDPAAFIQTPQALLDGPRHADWRVISAQAVVGGAVSAESDGRLRVEFQLWDVITEARIEGLAYLAGPDNWRRIAHIISDAIYSRMTGEGGYFDTQIVYISETGAADARVKRLAIMDQDGANHRFLTDGNTLVLTPRFSPSAREITYLAYYSDRPRVYLYNIDTGRQEVLGDFPGMTFAPRFSPGGNRVIFSWAQDGNSDIYTMSLATRQVSRLTSDPGIDTSPSFSPDGRSVVFESDRGGSQQLYVMDGVGGAARRISHGEGRYASPVWSPRADLIAFTNIHQGRFRIGVMRPDGSGQRLLTEAFHVEGPTWSPNGRVIMYFTQTSTGAGSRSTLHTIDLTGRIQGTVPTPQDGSDPAWSPLNP